MGLKVARGIVETLRVPAPMVSLMLTTIMLLSLQGTGLFTAELVTTGGVNAALLGLMITWLLFPAVLLITGMLRLLVTVVAKWMCVDKHELGNRPLWSEFVWLNELQDAFVKMVAVLWYLNPAMATGDITRAMRLLGASVGHGVWLETYWLPETDLVTIDRGASVGRNCVVQTHLFTDRVMTLDTIRIGRGSVLGPRSVALPASVLGDDYRVEPGSLAMCGDHVPTHTSWRGNPIEPVVAETK